MAFFEEIGKKISKSGQDAAQKAKNMAETVRLNGLVSEEKRRIENTFTKIGKLYYETFKENPEPCFSQLVTDINDAEKNIKKYTEQIRQVKGVAICDNCGGEVSNTAPFCSACGSAITPAASANTGGSTCMNCNSALAPDQAFCTGCGTKVEQLQTPVQEDTPLPSLAECTNCGHELAENVQFCLNCGTKIGE